MGDVVPEIIEFLLAYRPVFHKRLVFLIVPDIPDSRLIEAVVEIEQFPPDPMEIVGRLFIDGLDVENDFVAGFVVFDEAQRLRAKTPALDGLVDCEIGDIGQITKSDKGNEAAKLAVLVDAQDVAVMRGHDKILERNSLDAGKRRLVQGIDLFEIVIFLVDAYQLNHSGHLVISI